jgi:hypothetical protein
MASMVHAKIPIAINDPIIDPITSQPFASMEIGTIDATL